MNLPCWDAQAPNISTSNFPNEHESYQWLLGFEFLRAVFTCSGVSMSPESRNIGGHRQPLQQESKSIQLLV